MKPASNKLTYPRSAVVWNLWFYTERDCCTISDLCREKRACAFAMERDGEKVRREKEGRSEPSTTGAISMVGLRLPNKGIKNIMGFS